MKEYFSSLISHLSSRKGFTLIELMVVLSITSVLGILGIAGFTTYNQVQTLQSSANDLVTTLNLARSRALSQVKLGENCSLASNTLDSYEVAITIPTPSYSLKVNCHNGSSFSNQIYSKSLPDGVSFKNDPDTKPTTFTFPVLVGGVQNAGQITLSAYQRDKTIAINSLGGINIQLPILTPRPTPTIAPTPTIIPTPTLTPLPVKRVFNNSTHYSGNLGGLTGADAKCQTSAEVASLGGTWKAWLSTSTVNAKDRIPDAEYRLVDNTTVIANNKADLTDGNIDNPISLNEYGVSYLTNVWTGTRPSGLVMQNSLCSDWTGSSSNISQGVAGRTSLASGAWTNDIVDWCNSSSFGLYCFEE